MPLHQRANPAHDKQTPEKKLNACHDLSVWNKWQKSHIYLSQNFKTLKSIMYLLEKEDVLEQAAFGQEVKVMLLFPPLHVGLSLSPSLS